MLKKMTQQQLKILKECVQKLKLIEYMWRGMITIEESKRLSQDKRYLAGLKETNEAYSDAALAQEEFKVNDWLYNKYKH